ncbi:LysR substrate-binding domain-containing protein [Novosphingobium sp.]|uniref:LysR substrate-binding domain-containing protein n=1 Tax=Novosphingobium sp. TaxID=1874826 RepID=UPI0038B8ADE8
MQQSVLEDPPIDRQSGTNKRAGHEFMDTNHLAGKAIPPFAALRAFEVVGRLGGVRRAASALLIDHTVVSRHLKALEEWLGIALFERQGGKLILTEAGSRYHARISGAILDVISATRDIMADGRIEDVRLWCIPGFATQWLSDQLAAFERTRPGFQVELRPTDYAANLAQFEADIDIRYYGDDWGPKADGPGLKVLELARPPLMIVTSPALADGLSAMSSAQDLLSAPLLHEENGEQWRAWLIRNGATPRGPLAGPLLWHAHLAIAAARQGRGLALANRYLVAADLERGDLVEFAVPGTQPEAIGAYYLVARADRWNQPAVAKLRQFLVEQAA